MAVDSSKSARSGSGSGKGGDAAPRKAEAEAAWQLLRQALALAEGDVSAGRAELRDAMARLGALDETTGRLLAASALVQCIGIADDDYAGFEEAVAAIDAGKERFDAITDASDRLLTRERAPASRRLAINRHG